MRAAKAENLGFRDEQISDWHRSLGFDFPATDIDFLLVEYDKATPKALIEYKMDKGKKFTASHPSIKTLSRLADKAALPFYVVRYAEDLSYFRAYALNSLSRKYLFGFTKGFSAEEFVRFLKKLRNY